MDLISRKKGFTLIEILTVLAIIAILAGVLIPSMNMVRNTAKKVKQRTQLITIDQALMAFKNDMGYYPPSDWTPGQDYCGAQKLAEALVGWDLMGFHPESRFIALNDKAVGGVYDALDSGNLKKRVGPYLDMATANAFKLGVSSAGNGLFDDPTPLGADTFVLCDTYTVKKIQYKSTSGDIIVVKAGTPILYFKANTSSKSLDHVLYSGNFENLIYNWYDNLPLMGLGSIKNTGELHPFGETSDIFYSDDVDGIVDPKVTAASGIPWPYNPDTYILISAGPDGLYGTNDDITNFK